MSNSAGIGGSASATPASSPFTGPEPSVFKVISNDRISHPDAAEIRHLVLNRGEHNLEYREGQSLGVVIPTLADRGHSSNVRYYSIASSRSGDDGEGKTVSLCVKRVFKRGEDGQDYPSPASEYLCRLSLGEPLLVTGPVGKAFVLPADPGSHLVLVGTGTGVAPFRAFLRYLFLERSDWSGSVWLFFGAQRAGEAIYDQEFQSYGRFNNFHYYTALSREQTGHDGHRMYVHHRIHEQQDRLWNLLDLQNSYFYICGKRGMEEHIDRVFEQRAHADGVSWSNFRHLLLDSGRLLIETY